jgi:hypothetical protein
MDGAREIARTQPLQSTQSRHGLAKVALSNGASQAVFEPLS